MSASTAELRVWPRLLHAARQVDEQLYSALVDLKGAGALLEVGPDGGLKLSAGTMGEAAYQKVRSEQLAPKGPRMANILQRARTLSHPWLATVQEAAEDLAKRCRGGSTHLATNIEYGQLDRANAIAVTLIERQIAATYVCQALYLAGWQGYGDRTAHHAREMMALVKSLVKGGISFRASGIVWPIMTPDGRIWVADTKAEAPDQVKVDKELLTRAPEEPLLDDYDLADILAPLDTQGARREVV